MKKIFNAIVWLAFTSITIVSLILISNLLFSVKPEFIHQDSQAKIVAGSQEASQEQVIHSQAELKDARAAIVANFLQKYDSPLKPYDYYSQVLVEIADRYELDFRFLPAIMMEESNLCKNIPEGTNNCLGFGIHSRGRLGFDSYEAGFERAARELRANYVEEGRIQVSQIAKKYTASVDKWTNSVNQWMAEMKYDDRYKGLERKTDASVLEYARPDSEQ